MTPLSGGCGRRVVAAMQTASPGIDWRGGCGKLCIEWTGEEAGREPGARCGGCEAAKRR